MDNIQQTTNDRLVAPRLLRALLVVSRVTFVPGNDDALVCALACCPQIAGLLVLDNKAPKLLVRGVGLLYLGARHSGWTLLGNYLGGSDARRRQAYASAGKPVWQLPTINCAEAVALVKAQQIDLLVNSRTRFIYRQDILTAPRLGCLNIHHGLLPEQRGTMCDLWALSEQQPAGFSIHQMTEHLDAGGIVRRVQVSDGQERDYPAYLSRASQHEASELPSLLEEIERLDAIPVLPNIPTSPVVMRHDPTPQQLRTMLKAGMRL